MIIYSLKEFFKPNFWAKSVPAASTRTAYSWSEIWTCLWVFVECPITILKLHLLCCSSRHSRKVGPEGGTYLLQQDKCQICNELRRTIEPVHFRYAKCPVCLFSSFSSGQFAAYPVPDMQALQFVANETQGNRSSGQGCYTIPVWVFCDACSLISALP